MRIFTLALTLLIAIAFVGTAIAVGPGKTVEYAGGKDGKVVFSGDSHKVNKCNECHKDGLFKAMKKGSVKITAPHKAGEFCGACHDGKKAFNEEGNCAKCHKKAAGY